MGEVSKKTDKRTDSPAGASSRISKILKETFEEGQRYQQHIMQGENPKYLFSGAAAQQEIEVLIAKARKEGFAAGKIAEQKSRLSRLTNFALRGKK